MKKSNAKIGRASLLILLLSLAFGLTARDLSEPETKELSIGFISTESSRQLRQGFDPFVEVLSQRIGLPIKSYYATDYAGVIEAMRFKKIDLAWCGNKSAVEAVDRANAEVFAQITKADGSPGYHSVVIVNRDSPYHDIDSLLEHGKQLSFGNGDPNSTSAYLVPRYYLWAPRGIDPRNDFKIARSANHEVNCMAVAMGQIDFAATNNEAIVRLEINRPELASRLRVVWQSPLIPNDPFIWRTDLPDTLKSKIKSALLGFGRDGPDASHERELLAAIQDGWGLFLESDNTQLLPIRELMVESEMISVNTDTRLSEIEKHQLLAKLQLRKENLSQLRIKLESSNK